MRLNTSEKMEYSKLRAEGWEVLRNGWPDFLAEKDGQFRFIEVKRKPDRLSTAQRAMCRALFRLTGIKLEVRYYGVNAPKPTAAQRKAIRIKNIREWARNLPPRKMGL